MLSAVEVLFWDLLKIKKAIKQFLNQVQEKMIKKLCQF